MDGVAVRADGRARWRCLADEVGPLLALVSDPYDVRHLPVIAFPPALALLAGLGHMLRAHVDQSAWLRQAGFRLQIDAIEIEAAPADLAALRARVGAMAPFELPYIEFVYEDLDDEGYRRYLADRLTHLDAAAIERLVEQDADALDPVMAQHAAAIQDSFRSFLSERLGVVLDSDVTFSLEVRGLSYDDGAPLVRQRPRSELETGPRPAPRRLRIGGRR
jgi:hypothetical protein